MKPILFNTEMVRAIVDGRKTVTRRIIKPQPQSRLAFRCMGHKCGQWGYPSRDAHEHWGDPSYKIPKEMSYEEYQRVWTPPCNTGDILYVRETWSPVFVRPKRYLYKADADSGEGEGAGLPIRWHPSIHMPKEAARIFLRVKRVSVQRLQDCGNAQAKDEGCTCCAQFIRVWDSTIEPKDQDKYSWVANPWVWVIEFERCEKPEGE